MRGSAEATVADRPLQDQAARNLPWLYAGRGIRSFTAAFLTVVFPLYLAARHEPAATVGIILTVSSLITGGLILLVGILGDRVGRKPMLLMGAGLAVVGCALLVVTPNVAMIMVASGLGSIGRGGGAGSGGGFGPLYPAEQPLLAASIPSSKRTAAFGTLGAIGVCGGAAGSLVAWVPDAFHSGGMSLLSAYRLIFGLGAALSLLVVAASVPVREPRRQLEPADAPSGCGKAPAAAPGDTGSDGAPQESISIRQIIGRLTVTNTLNGLGFGFLGPLLIYWFHVRFGVSSGLMGSLYFVINVLTVAPYLGSARLVRRVGAVKAVVVSRTLGTIALVGMALAGSFELAAMLLAVRTLCNALSNPARQSYLMGVAHEGRRSLVAAISQLPSQVSSSASPAIGGALMPVVLDFPIFGAAFFQFLSAVTYYLAFRNVAERVEPLTTEDEDPVVDPTADDLGGYVARRSAAP